jgi:transposase InsO family protein
VGHRRAKLTPFGRLLLVQRIEVFGWPAVRTAEMMGVSRATAYKWVRRFREEGIAGLEDRSSAPTRRPHALAERDVRRIVRARQQLKVGPHRLGPMLGHPRSTVYAVLRRHGLSRLAHLDRPSGIPIRYERDHPGELVHLDVKKLGKVPPGGGHRVLGRAAQVPSHRGLGYDYLHVAIDDRSRLAYVEALADERGDTTAGFIIRAAAFYASYGITIERVLTDNAKNYTTSHAFAAALAELGIAHRRTRPYRPQTNGKAERFNRTLLDEWAYSRTYLSNEDRLARLPRWFHAYNSRRPHTALGGRPPMAVL